MPAEAILNACKLFARVTEPSRSTLLDMAVIRRFPAGETIFRQGDPCPGLFLVGTGLVRIFMLAPTGKQQILHQVTDGGTFAEVATIGQFDCPAFAEAALDTECLLLPNQRFQRALQEDHALCLQLLGGLAGRVHHFVELLENITLRDAAGRVARFLLKTTDSDHDRVLLPGLKKDLANQLNLTSETFSRTLRRLIDAGIVIPTQGQELQIASRERLQHISDGLFPLF
ncbi:MAG TPA: Crp/Fnr family transcriptional regulator [Candidatus Competibacteraceae bacterium]|nr:MAG: Crp/Fnr family transcriptional regulator [Candidatus Competibacteraceae bacterium]HOB63326.1 Crp/Fnr family transcriptional regulator [Candidatus Competibacteraceae bacterium]HQA26532.1 Crp/Fnr family transcriptional regulator [Candidatus Competibacteraceae bacterium]HQD54855.1 Crp/Fnr family transcriptional regulator [Candidatus Competibacteraceae bacterium]